MAIVLIKGQEVLVDDDVAEMMQSHTWHINPKNGYVVMGCCRPAKICQVCNKRDWSSSRCVCIDPQWAISGGQTVRYLSRIVTNAPEGMVVDHINHNKLDNRRCNLRIVTTRQNLANTRAKGGTSEYKGVHYDIARGRWKMSCRMPNGKRIVKRFDTELEAAQAYDRLAKSQYGFIAILNFG
jgi:HNH endonuclease/AP2 domain